MSPFSLLSFMKYLILLTFLLSSSLYGQTAKRLNTVEGFAKLTSDDSIVCKNILESFNYGECLKHCIIKLDSKLLLTVRTEEKDEIYLIYKGEIERYYEILPNGQFIDYGTEEDAQ